MGAWERALLSPMGWPLPGGCPRVGGQAEVSPSSPGAVAALSWPPGYCWARPESPRAFFQVCCGFAERSQGNPFLLPVALHVK